MASGLITMGIGPSATIEELLTGGLFLAAVVAIPTPTDRIYGIRAESRLLTIDGEERLYGIRAESRLYRVDND
jgi:hypothetical protein